MASIAQNLSLRDSFIKCSPNANATLSEEITLVATLTNSTTSTCDTKAAVDLTFRASDSALISTHHDNLGNNGFLITKKTCSYPPCSSSLRLNATKHPFVHDFTSVNHRVDITVKASSQPKPFHKKKVDENIPLNSRQFNGENEGITNLPSSIESTFLKLSRSEFCSTVVHLSERDHEVLEVIACLNYSLDSQPSTVHALDETASVSKLKTSGLKSPSFLVKSAISLFACSSETLEHHYPRVGSVIEFGSLFNISCTTSDGQYETVDAQLLGFAGSVAVFEEGNITAMDLASEIMSSLLRRNLNESQNWHYHTPVVSEIDANSDFIDFCFLILQSANDTVSGVKVIATGYVLFMMGRNEIRVEKYSFKYHQEQSVSAEDFKKN